jgi:hypothetical protein
MATLDDNPVGEKLEHLVAAHFVSRGCFVDTKVTERAPEDVSDIDVVWTDYRLPSPRPKPVEVKSGTWAHEDLFKFRGWMGYLGLESGQFAYTEIPDKFDQVGRVATKIGIELLRVDPRNVEASFASLNLPAPAATHLPALWRFSYAARSRLFESIQQAIKQKVCPESAIRAKEHLRTANDAIFFEADPTVRLTMLLRAHIANPKLANTCAGEIAGDPPNFENPPTNTPTFNAALYDGKHFPVQACLYLGNRLRLQVIKAAVDAHLAIGAGELKRMVLKHDGNEFDLGYGIPTTRYANAIEHYARFPWFPLLPVFWQVFLWGWGGFLLADRIEAEFQQLSLETGVPLDGMEEALAAFDWFFGDKWISRPVNDTRRVLRLMPAALRGIGAHHRRVLYGPFRDRKLSDYTPSRIAKDYACAARLLDAERKDLTT